MLPPSAMFVPFMFFQSLGLEDLSIFPIPKCRTGTCIFTPLRCRSRPRRSTGKYRDVIYKTDIHADIKNLCSWRREETCTSFCIELLRVMEKIDERKKSSIIERPASPTHIRCESLTFLSAQRRRRISGVSP